MCMYLCVEIADKEKANFEAIEEMKSAMNGIDTTWGLWHGAQGILEAPGVGCSHGSMWANPFLYFGAKQ